MQNAVDMNGRDRSALLGRQQNTTQRIAERHAITTLKRLGDDSRHAARIVPGDDFELVRLDEFLPVLLDHVRAFQARGPIGPSTLAHDIGVEIDAQTRRPARQLDRFRSNASALARTAAVVRNRRHVANRGHSEPGGLQGAQGRFTARTRA